MAQRRKGREVKVPMPWRRRPRRETIQGGDGGYVRRYLLRQDPAGYIGTYDSLPRALLRLRAEYRNINLGTTLTIATQNDNLPIYSVTKTFFGALEKRRP